MNSLNREMNSLNREMNSLNRELLKKIIIKSPHDPLRLVFRDNDYSPGPTVRGFRNKPRAQKSLFALILKF